MQAAMDRIDSFVRRRRTLVLVAWGVLLVAAIPFTVRQTDPLTSGGFPVPGSGSGSVDKALHDFEGAQSEQLAVVLALREGGTAAAVRAEIDRVDAVARELPNVELTDAAAAEARRRAGDTPITIVPLALSGGANEAVDTATDLREELAVGDGARNGVEPHLVCQQALWAG